MNRYGEFVTYRWCPRDSGGRENHQRQGLMYRVLPRGFDADGLWRTDLACMTIETAASMDVGQTLPMMWR